MVQNTRISGLRQLRNCVTIAKVCTTVHTWQHTPRALMQLAPTSWNPYHIAEIQRPPSISATLVSISQLFFRKAINLLKLLPKFKSRDHNRERRFVELHGKEGTTLLLLPDKARKYKQLCKWRNPAPDQLYRDPRLHLGLESNGSCSIPSHHCDQQTHRATPGRFQRLKIELEFSIYLFQLRQRIWASH